MRFITPLNAFARVGACNSAPLMKGPIRIMFINVVIIDKVLLDEFYFKKTCHNNSEDFVIDTLCSSNSSIPLENVK